MTKNSAAELRLLVEANTDAGRASRGSVLTLNSKRWTLTSALKLSKDVTVEGPAFVCISYVWGFERIPNPLELASDPIPSSTLPALSSAMLNTHLKAFWIDAFCVPLSQPARRATLESMGYIYNLAAEVRVVLSQPSFMAIQQLSTSDILDEAAFRILEEDPWIRSVWTYQEVVNSRHLVFTCPDAPGAFVEGSNFLNGVGYTMHKYGEENQLDSFAIRERFPSLDALQDVIADWLVSDYTKRSALAVMSNIERRSWTDNDNYFFAMLGAVTETPCWRRDVQGVHPSETFIETCEAKGDFSFIYSSSARAEDSTRGWRPRCGGLLPSILPWHSWGEAQPGHFDEAGFLWLDKVLQLQQTSQISDEAKRHIGTWLQREELVAEDKEVLSKHMHVALVRMGFTGSQESIVLKDGLFFPQVPISREQGSIEVLVSTTIRWTLGAPGITCKFQKEGSCIPGVFVGVLDLKAVSSACLI